MHQGKLKFCQPISAGSGFMAYVFTMAGVTAEGPEEVASLSPLDSLVRVS